MKLQIPKNKAIEILRKRLREIDSFDFQPDAWKDKTENDLKEIFSLGDGKWLQVSRIDFTTFIDSEKDEKLKEGKKQAKQLLESYIEQIEEYSKIQEEKEIIEEDNYQKKYSDLLQRWNKLVPDYNSILEEKEGFQEVIESKDREINNRDGEIERLKRNTVQLDNISLLKLLKLVFSLPVGQVIAFFVIIASIISGSFKLGMMFSDNKSENRLYDLRKTNDELQDNKTTLELKVRELEVIVDSLENKKTLRPTQAKKHTGDTLQ